jgi:hypothetical protein
MKNAFICQGNTYPVTRFKDLEELFIIPAEFMQGMITMRTKSAFLHGDLQLQLTCSASGLMLKITLRSFCPWL